MELSNFATTLQIAGYFNRAEKCGHPALKASILGSLLKRFYPNYNGIRFIDGKYYMNFNKVEFLEFTSFEMLIGFIKDYIQNNFGKIQALVKNDPMLFIS